MEETHRSWGVPKIQFGKYFGEHVPKNGVELRAYTREFPADYAVIASGQEKRAAQVREIAYREMVD